MRDIISLRRFASKTSIGAEDTKVVARVAKRKDFATGIRVCRLNSLAVAKVSLPIAAAALDRQEFCPKIPQPTRLPVFRCENPARNTLLV